MNYKDTQRAFAPILALVLVILVLGGIIWYARSSTPIVSAPGASSSSNTQSAQESNVNGKNEGAAMGPGVVFKDGKLMLEEGEKMTPLQAAYSFPTGVNVSLSGLVTKADGATVQLKDGESAWQDGSVMKAGAMMGEKTGGKTTMGNSATAAMAGTYEPYDPSKIARAAQGKVVLFFHASWCPTCRALDSDIKAHMGAIPVNLTILDVDYDNSAVLQQKYGVTSQHTLVQVDAGGKQITKWQGSMTLADFVTHIK